MYGPRVVGVDIASGLTRFLAGSSTGYADGTGTDAWLSDIPDLASDGANLYLPDTANNRIRTVSDAQPSLPCWQPCHWMSDIATCLPEMRGGSRLARQRVKAEGPLESADPC